MCSSLTSNADSGNIYDSGGAGGSYSNYEYCGFLIQPSSSPTNITLNFSQFAVETNYDFLYVYDGTSTSGTLLGQFTGYSLPNNITATSGSMYLVFSSDSNISAQGFSASWTSTTVDATLIASYNFDDDWISNNSLTDQTGSYNGSPGGALSRILAGSNGPKGDTCYAGSFTGGSINISGLPVSTATGAKTSVSFWMYWDGTKNVMPLGWDRHDLFFGANNSGSGNTIYFGFNTWGWDVTGISASGLTAGWHHVAATFTNGSVANNKLFIDGVLQSIAYRTGTVTTSNAYVQSTLVIGATGASSSWPFKGKIDNLKIYTGAITALQVTSDMNESNICSGGGGDTAATNFNCVENGTDGIAGKLFTKTTAQSFSFDIVALKDASTIETSFASGADHTVTVELVNAETAASCSSYPALSPAVSQNLTITSADSGIKSSASMLSGTAYSKAKCRITDATDSPSVIGCSTDSFAIRPTTFNVSSNLTNTGSTGLPKAKAGENFTLTATATAGYGGTPRINNSNLQAHAGANQTGTISGAFSAADSTAGIATGTTFSYSEAGSMRFAAQGVYDDSFTLVDQAGDCTNNFSNTPDASGKVGCMFGNTLASNYFGRFTPDHFKITAFANGLFSDTCTSFTYTGQTFSYQTAPTLTVTAYNGLSVPLVTENYTGTYANGLSATDFNVTVPTADSTQAGADGSTLVNLESWVPGTASLADNGNGSLTFTFGSDNYRYRHESNSIIAPFTASVDLEFTDITDNDNIQTPELPYTIQASGASMRFGRLNIDNVHGSELMPLPVPLYTEYYNGTSFITHADDVCTAIAISDLSFNGGINPIAIGTSTSIASIANSPLNAGVAGLSLSTPNKPGYIDITTGAFISSYSWLGYDWNGDGAYDNAPSARATFGIYKGNSQQIYFREVY